MRALVLCLCSLLVLSLGTFGPLSGLTRKTARVAVLQVENSPRQDPFLADYDPAKVRPQMLAHLDKVLRLFDQAGRMGADIVCGPEDIQRIGAYGLHVDVNDPQSGEILFTSLAEPVPGPLTEKIAEIARRHRMYVIAPLYERDRDRVFNTAVIFDREGRIIGKHRKTHLPVMETWGVDTGDEYEVFDTDFARIAVATCWELFFQEITRIYALKGADIIFSPTMAVEAEDGKGLSTAHRVIARAMDNYVYVAPVIHGTENNGIVDFNGKVLAEAVGVADTVILAEIDFSKEPILESTWWTTINGTDNQKAIHYLSRRPEIFKLLTDPNPPLLERYRKLHLTTGDRKRQIQAVRAVDYGPKKDTR